MGTIGIHPKLKDEVWLYGHIQRWTGYVVLSGKFDHLVPPGKNLHVVQPKQSRRRAPSPFNGGGAAA